MVTTFKTWIGTQSARGDVVGRLSHVINTDIGAPEGLWKANWLDHLALRKAGPGATAAFEKAWEEYSITFLDKYR
jgi:hypothetical protein